MKFTIESLQNALLVFTVVVLVYVLYKRLLHILGKKERQKKYPTVGEKIEWNDKKASLEITFYEKANLQVLICNNSGDIVERVLSAEYDAGLHHIDVSCDRLQSGRYYFKLISPFQEFSLYFDIN